MLLTAYRQVIVRNSREFWRIGCRSQSALGMELAMTINFSEAYVKYGGNIDVINDEKVHRDNPVVKAIHSNLPKIMGGLHKLLDFEAKHELQMSEESAMPKSSVGWPSFLGSRISARAILG